MNRRYRSARVEFRREGGQVWAEHLQSVNSTARSTSGGALWTGSLAERPPRVHLAAARDSRRRPSGHVRCLTRMLAPVVVPGRPGTSGLLWWTLTDGPAAPVLRLSPDDPAAPRPRVVHSLRRLGDGFGSHGIHLVAVTGLDPDRQYALEVTDAAGVSMTAASRTLPVTMRPGVPFTISFGSCYQIATDARLIETFYPPKRPETPDMGPIRLRFLLGDQSYMDLSKTSAYPESRAPDYGRRYVEQWTDAKTRYGTFLARGPNIFVADDHEIWNDYPHKGPFPRWSEKGPGGPIGTRAIHAFRTFQAALNVDPAAVVDDAMIIDRLVDSTSGSFRFDVDDLSFFVLDTRTRRTLRGEKQAHFSSVQELDAVLRWLRTPGRIGILALAVPVTSESKFPSNIFDRHLVDYRSDYRALLDAIVTARKKVCLLAGDIHRSQLLQIVPTAGVGFPFYELASSPLSLIDLPFFAPKPKFGKDVTGKLPGDVPAEWEMYPAAGSTVVPGRYSSLAPQTYGTLTLVREGPDPAALVTARARAWGPPSDVSAGAEMLLESTIKL